MQVADQIREYVRHLHPDQRGAIRRALDDLSAGRARDIRPLSDDLEGYYRLRIGKFRVIFRYAGKDDLVCEYLGVRATVYESFTSMRDEFESRWNLEDEVAPFRSKARKRKPARTKVRS